ncbi:MAG: Maf family nucleotide pyrophosphatase [Pseudomonadota bacterium]|nr:Maf family nucleotide pyrophosphatase [Pseudomonadota bacterium]
MSAGLVLASGSATRQALLRDAGVAFRVVKSGVDEAPFKHPGRDPVEVARTLADAKAAAVAAREPGATVIGADQVLALDGAILDKPGTRTRLVANLYAMAGRRHSLLTVVSVWRDGARLWSWRERADLHMRPLDSAAIADYVAAAPDDVLDCAGGYQVEGAGIRLFERIDGDWHGILGLPLLPLLRWLRGEGLA